MNSFSPTRRLGQNFLIDRMIADRIVASCDLQADEEVLEIGPGQGALTRDILPRVKSLIAVEADPRLCAQLREDLLLQGLEVREADILSYDFTGLAHVPIKVIGNIPYNISTPIMEKMIHNRRFIKSLFLTVQLEFAKRLIAPPGLKDRSALTCFMDLFAVSRILFRISNQAFRPVPKVESCFLRVDFLTALGTPLEDEGVFFKVVKQAFLQRRKTLLNALSPLGPKKELQNILHKAGVNEKIRPEDVKSQDYVKIANLIITDL